MLPPRTQVNVALLGFGNVGRAFARYVKASPDLPVHINIAAVADSSGGLFLSEDSLLERALAHKESARLLTAFETNASILDSYEFVRATPIGRHLTAG